MVISLDLRDHVNPVMRCEEEKLCFPLSFFLPLSPLLYKYVYYYFTDEGLIPKSSLSQPI